MDRTRIGHTLIGITVSSEDDDLEKEGVGGSKRRGVLQCMRGRNSVRLEAATIR